ncbi:MAG: hypothetical protein RLZZ258_1086 [Actinomycetota bacterium]|jgi:hypothetical protein
MSDELVSQVKAEVQRISELELEEQPSAFASVREQLEAVLNATPNSAQN